MKKYDTEDDWTYWVKDDELMSDAKYIINKNRIFNEKFKKYGIKSYETSQNREQVFNEIISDLKETLELDTSSIKRH
jgi:NADPH-dependent 7-cyano-7-deazaguanine reductase QueF